MKNTTQYNKSDTLKSSVNDGMANAAMLGFGETYLSAFAIFLNGTSFQIGMLASLPLLVGSIFQTLGVWLIEKFQSRKKIMLYAATLQALIWLPIAFLPFIFRESCGVSILVFLAVLYQTMGSLTAPAWNSLMGDLVPVETRGSYFGYRNKQIGIVTLITIILAGESLHFFERINLTFQGYIFIFLLALAARLLSVSYLKRYEDIAYHPKKSDHFTFWQFVIKTPKSNYARFVFFVAFMNFSAYIAGPFFSVYLLNDIKVSYFEYTLIISSVAVTQILAMQYWGTLSDRFGNRQIMSFCGIGVCLIPLFWLLSANTLVIILIQAFAGFFWAGFNLAGANFMFDAVTPPKRARCVAYQAIVNSIFICLGAFLGSFLAKYLSGSNILSHGLNTPDSIYLRVFTISAAMRILVIIFLFRMFKEVRPVEKVRHRDLIFSIATLRPLSGYSFGITGLIGKRGKKLD
jgi:MFS family permease